MTDEDLMLRAGAGDSRAFAALYERHKAPLVSFCYRMLRNWEDAADVFQETFRYLHAHAAEYEPVAGFRSYATRIARNLCIDILRKRRRRRTGRLDPGLDLPAPDDGPELDRAEVEARLRAALDDVPDPYREVLHLRIVDSMEYAEIAETLGCPVGTVKSRLHSALGVLRDLVRKRRIVE